MDNIPIHFTAQNVRGLRDNNKRRNVFQWLKGKNIQMPQIKGTKGMCPDIILISETHCHSKKDTVRWGLEWSHNKENSIWSKGTSNSKGVAILINEAFRQNNPTFTISNKMIDSNGRFVKCILTVNGCHYRLISIYAPNKPLERVKFFSDCHVLFDDGIDAENILGGDWNCALNPLIDRYNCVGTNDIGQRDLQHLNDLFDLEDVWRRRNPENKEYTWHGRGKKSRIDYWLTSVSLGSQIDIAFHSFAPYTDHSAINIILNTKEIKRGKGTWKMNAEHLLNTNFREGFISMWHDWQQKKHEYTDIKVWWDLGKRHIKTYAQQFAREINFKNKSKLREIEKKWIK